MSDNKNDKIKAWVMENAQVAGIQVFGVKAKEGLDSQGNEAIWIYAEIDRNNSSKEYIDRLSNFIDVCESSRAELSDLDIWAYIKFYHDDQKSR